MKKLAVALTLVLIATSAQAGRFKKAVGKDFPQVKVQDLHSGKAIDLSAELKKDNIKAAVVIFSCVACPTVKSYKDRINDLVDAYGANTVFLTLNANSGSETPEVWAEHTKEEGFKGVIAFDKDSAFAKAIGAGATPEAYLLDESGKVVYHGPVDDSEDVKYVETPFLKNALDALLAGKAIPEADREVPPHGCSIRFPKKD